MSGDLYIYCMALFIDVELMIDDDDDDESFKFWGSKDLCQNTKIKKIVWNQIPVTTKYEYRMNLILNIF